MYTAPEYNIRNHLITLEIDFNVNRGQTMNRYIRHNIEHSNTRSYCIPVGPICHTDMAPTKEISFDQLYVTVAHYNNAAISNPVI